MKNTKPSISRMFIKHMVSVILAAMGLVTLIWIWGENARFTAESEVLRSAFTDAREEMLEREVAGVIDYIDYMTSRTESRLKTSIKEQVYVAHQIAESLFTQNRALKSDAELKKLIKDALRPIRFNQGRGYVFAVSMDGIEQLYPVRPELERESIYDLRDAKGNYVIRNEIHIVREQGEGFVTGFWPKPDRDPSEAFPKISFVKYFAPLDWYLGAGEYLDDVTSQVQQEVIERVVNLRFGADGYFFASTYTGDPLFSNGKITRGTENISDITDPNGFKIIENQQKTARQPNGGFVAYVWPKLDSGTPVPKISYVRSIPEWEWVIGAGVYLDAVEAAISQKKADLKKDLFTNIGSSVLAMMVLFLLFLIWGRQVSRKIQNGIDAFSRFFKSAAEQSTPMRLKDLHFAEFVDIADAANRMLADRAAAEQALRESKEKYRVLVSHSNDVIYSLDPDFRILSMSPSVEKSLGYAPEALVGRKFQDAGILDSEYLEQATSDTLRLLAGETITSAIYGFMAKDGTRKVAEISSAPLFHDGRVAAIISVARDITERRQAEQALKENELKFRTLFDFSPQAVALTDMETGRLMDVNQEFCRRTGFEKAEVVGHTTTELGFYSETDRARFVGELMEKGSVTGLEMTFNAKNNTLITALMYAEQIILGNQSFLLTIFIDVTEKKYMEARLRQSHKMESIGTLTGGIAHDFNNIMSIIIGNIELVMEDVPASDPIRESLSEIQTAGLRAAAIVKQLLDFSRSTDQALTPTAMAPVINETLDFLRSTIPATITIRKELNEKDTVALADPVRMHQVVMNLCINAFHAMETTGGELTVGLRNVLLSKVAARLHPDLTTGDYVEITVRDTGPGINPEIMDRIFDPYFTTREFGKGSGMGLAMVHGIVKNHGGAILAENGKGGGARFTVFIPAAGRQPTVSAPHPEPTPTGREAILLVDDEAPIVKLTRQRLERLNYHVTAETNPETAMAVFSANPDRFDLVITDMTMPQMNGLALAEKIKAVRPDVPIIICTGYSVLVNEETAGDLDIAAFLTKPVAKRDLAETIRRVLDGKK